jgi:4-alpha-glucanotransferase
VLGLNRLWVIPDGADPTQGAYLRCPLDALLDGVAREARTRGAIVIGEDLGTVPPELPPRLEAAGLLGLRVLWFMRDHGLFLHPSRWPRTAVAMTTTHDLPTVAGWWQARDLDWRERAGQFRAGELDTERNVRAADRVALWNAFVHAGVARGPAPADAPAVVDAALRFVAQAPAPLALFPLEDLCGLDEQPNLPGTIDEHPNWRRRLPAEARELLGAPAVAARLRALRAARQNS